MKRPSIAKCVRVPFSLSRDAVQRLEWHTDLAGAKGYSAILTDTLRRYYRGRIGQFPVETRRGKMTKLKKSYSLPKAAIHTLKKSAKRLQCSVSLLVETAIMTRLAPLPKKPEEGGIAEKMSRRFHGRLERSLGRAAEKQARKRGISYSAFVRLAVERELKEKLLGECTVRR